MNELELAVAFLAAVAGSAINSIAGGGTLLTFPAIVALGVPPLVANATSTVALWPGSLGALWGYRKELSGARPWLVRFTLPSLVGGGLGGWLLLRTGNDAFARVVPFLVLGATTLFLFHGPIMRWLRGHEVAEADVSAAPGWGFVAAQAGVAIYGGYFGAGIGILMLAVLGVMGHVNIHQMNGLKNWGGLCINLVAAALFAVSGVVMWRLALSLALGSVLGGYLGARMAQRVGQGAVRKAIVVVGLVATFWLLTRG